MLATQAAANGAVFVDTYGPSIGRDACRSSSTRWVEPLVPANPAAPVHPNARGMDGMGAVVRAAIDAHTWTVGRVTARAYGRDMPTWTEFAAEAPELADLAEKRLAATGLMMLATLRADGFRASAPWSRCWRTGRLVLHDERLWLGMMPGATKSRDLQRDPRFALHTATADKMVTEET